MPNKRKANIVFNGDFAITLLKPYLNEYSDKLIVIYEDAYGDFYGLLMPISEAKLKLGVSDEVFNEILNSL